jgi:hypothetical protein
MRELDRRLTKLEAAVTPPLGPDVEAARHRLAERVAGIRERLFGGPLPDRSELSPAERFALFGEVPAGLAERLNAWGRGRSRHPEGVPHG